MCKNAASASLAATVYRILKPQFWDKRNLDALNNLSTVIIAPMTMRANLRHFHSGFPVMSHIEHKTAPGLYVIIAISMAVVFITDLYTSLSIAVWVIYFDRELQDRAVGLFRAYLARKGFLGLGAKESLRFSSHAEAFTEFVGKERVYQKNEGQLTPPKIAL
jgi:hypothetical protein